MPRSVILPLLGIACAVGCAHETRPTSPSATQPIAVSFAARGGEVTLSAELADTPEAHDRGLMYRRELGAFAGMIFVFAEEREHTFWMRNTYIPLDLIFIDNEKRIVGIVAHAEPMSDARLTVGKPSRYVVEVNAGFAEEHGVAAGSTVRWQVP